MALNRPNQLTTAFANAGLKNDIPQSATGSNLASYEEGFPVITMQAIADGGMPPQGQDFNGMFYTLTDIARYAQAGGLYPFDKEFCTAIGGYPLGAILTSLDGAKLYINQVNGNTNNPDTNSTNWQTVLTSTLLDAVPTADSTNPVASNGVFDALATKQNTLTFDNAPTSGSINPVTSGGIKTALDAKQDTLTFDSTPTADSNNPVTSQGIKAAIDAKDSLPSQTGNAGKVLTTDGTSASWSEPPSGRQILETFYTFRTDVGPINGAYDANGTVYNRSDFSGGQNPYDLLVAGKAKSCSFAEYETQLSTYGSCGLFGLDTETQRFRVPTLKNILEPTVLSSAIGQIVEAGLPNIEGNISIGFNGIGGGVRPSGVGAFYHQGNADSYEASNTGVINNLGSWDLSMDASRSSPIYGKSTTVQPQTIKVRPMVQLATSGQEISIEQYEQQLSDYARTNTLNGRLIGEIIQSALPLTDAGVHLLDGSQIQNSGIYAQFCTYVANLQADYPDLFCTEAEFTASVEAYGSCGKFVNGASYIRLPKVSDILQGTTDVTAVGDLIEAGLPNITGGFKLAGGAGGLDYGYGAFYTPSGSSFVQSSWSGSISGPASFDASRSSQYYKDNVTKPTPQTIKALLYICVATSVKTPVEANIDNIATDLNNKLDRDLSNVVGDAVERVVEQGDNYIRFSSGEQFVWLDVVENTSAVWRTITFPVPFLSNYSYVVVGCPRNTGDTTSNTNVPLRFDNTFTTKCNVVACSGSILPYCNVFAFGRWK